ncbi:MAG: hypothetical protein COB00_17430 [Alcanivorax sp.]|nr:MAG: hypothetical protein COB00_17430 [Alcanivorax sp.]
MAWNFHHYYTNRTEGLIGKLRLNDDDENKLKGLREIVRQRTKHVFEEAKAIAKEVKKCQLSQESVQMMLANTKLRYLSEDDRRQVAMLLYDMDDEARDEFLNLSPRFWTQGSFQYDTLNRPFHPGQEMDIDDGTYMPMPIFESEPKIGHTLLLLLVDSSLKSLEAENDGWIFQVKQTCGRIKIPREKTHIDVPMYAIPKDQFLQKQLALEALSARSDSAMNKSYIDFHDSYEVDSEHVNLALRDGPQKWVNSDPKIVEDWFNRSCNRIGKSLRLVCRFMKAWRDAQWEVGGPSSISLMAATVNILDRVSYDKTDLGETIKVVAQHLPGEFAKGIASPDNTDDKLLFPAQSEHGPREQDIMSRLEELSVILYEAECASSKQSALDTINRAFGRRVTDCNLIVSAPAAPAFKDEPESASSYTKISSTMTSG